jgi:hypothetical protein
MIADGHDGVTRSAKALTNNAFGEFGSGAAEMLDKDVTRSALS